MKSMTGYGEGSQSVRGATVTVQIRSLNHRHLDLQLRVPREYLSLEEEIRKLLRGKISRGRIDLFVNRYAGKAAARKLEMDEGLVGQYIASVKQIKKKYGLAGEVGVFLLSNIPDLLHVREPEADPAAEREGLMKALLVALTKLERSREREGGQLRADVELQIRHLTRIASDLESRVAENALRLQRNVNSEGHNGSSDKEALDVGSMTSKGDVNEEIVRLKAHLGALLKVIREREPVGKKIDFMLQEVNRELNTISSKVPHLPVVQLVLQGKERAEKIREQAQNIE
jgi:TIGR00255 family protein